MKRARGTAQTPRTGGEWAALAGLAALYALARMLYRLAGVRFDATPLDTYWQYLAPQWLAQDLWRSLWHLHSQPPLYNLFLGIVPRLARPAETGYAITGIALGAAAVTMLYLLARRLGAGRVPALAAAALYAASPTLVLYENWLHYTLPVITLLLLSVFALERIAATGRRRWAAVFGTALAGLCLTMSFFHAGFIVLFGLVAAGLTGPARRRAVTAAGIALLVVLGWYAKNLAQSGTFSASSWFGMNLARMTHTFVPRPERESLARAGTLSPVAPVDPFSPLEAYPASVRSPASAPLTGIAALDQPRRPGGAPNFNHRDWPAISRLYRRDALWLMRHRPEAYRRSVLDANLIFFMPATAFGGLGENRLRARAAVLGAELLQGRVMYYIEPELQRTNRAAFYRQKALNMGLVLPLLFFAAAAASFVQAIRLRRREPARAAGFAAVGLALAYVWLAGTLLEVGENMRFRSLADPLLLAVLAGWFRSGSRRVR